MKSELLMIFIRNPIIGTVKTRLASKIGNKLALKVYNELTRHTASICEKIKTNTPCAPLMWEGVAKFLSF